MFIYELVLCLKINDNNIKNKILYSRLQHDLHKYKGKFKREIMKTKYKYTKKYFRIIAFQPVPNIN